MQWLDNWHKRVMSIASELFYLSFWPGGNLLITPCLVGSRVLLLGWAHMRTFLLLFSLLLPLCLQLLKFYKSKMIVFCLFKATPRLSEDKVKQCVDPRLKGEYPPKGVAKVTSLSIAHIVVFTIRNSIAVQWNSEILLWYWLGIMVIAAGCCGSSVCAVWSRVQAKHEHRRQGSPAASKATCPCSGCRILK